ncbi:MAG: VIT1/CCC1 transporter family protein [Proteobacteria bacterium]|nr:VIT1/CCC1 transporter family protein [Pseudomonadota bacterium]
MSEHHRSERIGWLRAAVLGANDGILSTASLIVGVAAAHAEQHSIVLAGVSGLVVGAMSMAAGELIVEEFASSLVFLAVLGSLAARAVGATTWRGAARVTFGGALAMGVTAGIGTLFGTAV